MVTTNFPNGVTNVLESEFFGNFRRPAPVGVTYGYWNDFPHLNTDDWTITDTGTPAYAITDAVGGVLTVTNSAADNDGVFAQLPGESFILAANKPAWFSTRIALDDVVESDWIAGLYVTDTDPITAITDGVYFIKADGAATVDFVSVVGSAATTLSDVATLVNDTFVTFEFYWDGTEYIHAWVDGAPVGRVAAATRPTGEMSLSWVIQNGEAVAKVLSMDWIGAELVR